MESISKILDAISAEAKSEAAQIAQNGRKSSEEVLRLYQKEAEIERENILKKAEKEAKEIRQRSLSQAGIESRNLKLAARRKALEETFSLALQKLTDMTEDRKKAFYEKLIHKFSESDQVTVKLNEEDTAALGKKLEVQGIKVNLDTTPGTFSGGLIIKEGSVETNCTFEVMIENAKKEMEAEIAAMLFS